MLRFRVWGLSAALAAGAGGASPATAADPPAKPPEPKQQTTLVHKLHNLFGPKAPKPGPRVAPPTITAPLEPEVLADALKAEKDALLRRLSVCTELRRVALERADDALARQADELERQAASLYNARVAGLGVSRVKSPLPEPAPAEPSSPFASTDHAPTPEQLAKAKAARLTAPPAPAPVTASAERIREVPQ
jgi:hypothetical protein